MEKNKIILEKRVIPQEIKEALIKQIGDNSYPNCYSNTGQMLVVLNKVEEILDEYTKKEGLALPEKDGKK